MSIKYQISNIKFQMSNDHKILKSIGNLELEIRNWKLNNGFTLIELLIVIAIIGTLAAFTMANFLGVKQRARDAQRKSDLHQLQSAFELYRSDQGSYPASLPACGAPFSAGSSIYMQKVPCDPLNTGQHTYTYTTTGTAYSLFACLENPNDAQKDAANNATYCTGGTTNWSYTLVSP